MCESKAELILFFSLDLLLNCKARLPSPSFGPLAVLVLISCIHLSPKILPLASPVLLIHTFPLPKFLLSTLSLELTVCKDEPYSSEAKATDCEGEMENK